MRGLYRFQNDTEFGKLCLHFHDGCPTLADFKAINDRVVSEHNPLPKDARVACQRNDEREAINVGTWLQHLKKYGADQGLIILADNIHVLGEGQIPKKLNDLSTFYTQVGEDDCSTHMEGRFAPMLRCYPQCPLMMTKNMDVPNNLANGTQGLCLGVTLKQNKVCHVRTIQGMPVQCAYASEVESLTWKVGKKIHFIQPKTYKSVQADFPLPPEHQAYSSDKKVTVHLQATQIPLISNNATTGHKLQGATIDFLYVPSWNYNLNWCYVVLSRVRSLKGLYLGKPLDPTKNYAVPKSLNIMLQMLRTSFAPSPFNYKQLHL